MLQLRKGGEMETLYTMPEVAEILKVTLQTVRNFIERGELVATRLGGAVRIAESDLKAFIEKGKK